MNLNVRKKEIDLRINTIKREVDEENIELEELSELEKELDELLKERNVIDKKLLLATKFVPPINNDPETNSLMRMEMLESRGKDLREKRAVKVSQEEILLPEHVSPQLAQYPFTQVSTLVDNINLVNLNGGETYKKTFVKEAGVAGNTLEGEDYAETEPEFGYVTITKSKLTAYTEITEELEKLPNVDYQAEVIKNITTSLKKKLSLEILKGNGSANNFTGIFSNNALALQDTEDLVVSEIDENTLVEGGAVLILNKNDLRAFARLRTEEGRKVHTIDYVNRTIDGIPYIINSNTGAISNPATSEGTYAMAYGALKNYEVAVFSPVEIAKSNDYKFKQGIICYKASVFVGGNVVGYQGFVRVKKGAAVTP
jgi:HK97 family phage major capsid protein